VPFGAQLLWVCVLFLNVILVNLLIAMFADTCVPLWFEPCSKHVLRIVSCFRLSTFGMLLRADSRVKNNSEIEFHYLRAFNVFELKSGGFAQIRLS
jgi:hypothetical protein